MKQTDRKKGYTLVEMVAVLMLVLPLISLVGILLRRSVVQYSNTIDRAFEMRAVEQWTERIRGEIHEANDAIVSNDGSSLTLTFSNQENTRYFQDGLRTVRQRSLDGRLLAIERSPWSSALHFMKTESSMTHMIVVETVNGPNIRVRLGIHASSVEGAK